MFFATVNGTFDLEQEPRFGEVSMNVVPFKTSEIATLRIRPEGSDKTIQWSGPLKFLKGQNNEELTVGVPIKRGTKVVTGKIKLEERFIIETIPDSGQRTVSTVYYPTHPVSQYMAAALEEKLSKNKLWRKIDFFSNSSP